MNKKNNINEKYNKQYYNENLNWKRKDLAKLYKFENPNASWKECWDRANILYKELKKMNSKTFRDNDRFFQMNTPFSFFDNKDGEFSDTPWDGKLE